jgi:cytochrome b pre-mRNA-processing protein 3
MTLGLKIGRLRHRDTAGKLYAGVVAAARRPAFYADLGVPDTVDGRFDLIALHAFLVLRRLRAEPAADLAQAFFDTMFDDMDRNLREMGAGDLGVGRRIKAMAKAFYGRIAAYDRGLAGDDRMLGEALRRNLYRKGEPTAGQVAALCGYLRREAAILDQAGGGALLSGRVAFGPPPVLEGE